jgi:outer membrane lipase/esterase
MGILDRMAALRGGAHGLSLTDLNVNVGGQSVSLGTLTDVARHVVGGGASADAAEPGGLLSDRVGIWVRGNYASGDQGVTQADSGFQGHQTTITIGIDDRLSNNFVVGAALGRALGDVAFGSTAGGGIDTGTWIGTLYASSYLAKNFYVDVVLNFAKSNYDTTRRITFQEGGITVDRTAAGATHGTTWSSGVNFGYDFSVGGLTVTPLAGYFFQNAQIDSFNESGAQGLDLDFDSQTYRSATANLGVQASYALKLPFGVLLPHARAEWLHEFEDNAALLNVHFDADPNAGTSTPPMVVQGDVPNRSYWRLSGGASLQFTHGVSAYVEYQRLTSYGALAYHDVAIGIRAQQLF